MASLPVNLISHSTLTASSTDGTGPCSDNKCDPNKLAIDGSLVYWQTVADRSCANQWLTADWSNFGSFDISGFNIDYGALGHTFSGTLVRLQFTSQTSARGVLPSANNTTISYSVLEYANCSSSADSIVAKTLFGEGRLDTCTFDTSKIPNTDTEALRNITGVTFTWSMSVPKEFPDAVCQMNVNEIDVFGLVSNRSTASTSAPSGSQVVGSPSGNNPISTSSGGGSDSHNLPLTPSGNGGSATTQTSAGLSIGAVTAIVLACICIFVGISIVLVRKRNLERRRRAQRLLVSSIVF